jgi:hypothetical protein
MKESLLPTLERPRYKGLNLPATASLFPTSAATAPVSEKSESEIAQFQSVFSHPAASCHNAHGFLRYIHVLVISSSVGTCVRSG